MATLCLSLLGPFSASFDERPLTKFRTRSVQALLIYLACTQEQIHRRDTLLALLWPGLPQKSAQDNLRQTLYQLRKLIPEVESRENFGPVSFLVVDRPTVQINPEGRFDLDVKTFEDIVSVESGVSQLEVAADLYRADFLADFYLPDNTNFEEWTLARRSQLRRQVLDTLGRLTVHYMNDEAYEQAEIFARRLLTIDDLREEGNRYLMEILAQSGRRNEALEQYDQLRRHLDAELGVKPEESTITLFQAIRSGEGVGFKEKDEEGPVLIENQTVVPSSLPVQLTPFIGRESELADLDRLLGEPASRLTTVVGPGGTGKTRLALAAAERQIEKVGETPFPDGIFFVPMASLASAALMAPAITEALRLRLEHGESPLWAFLKNKRLLLVLDNLEHLLENAHLVSRILQSAPNVRVLATSRERLQLQEEQVYFLSGLQMPQEEGPSDALDYAAGQLFVGTATRVRPDFTLEKEDRTTLVRICKLVEAMPLALELAAAWVEVLSLDDMEAEIISGLDFLETELRNVPERHRSMRAVFDATWKRLNPAEQELFTKLAVFRGGFTLPAVQGITGASLRDLAGLVNKSLLNFNSAARRYHIHELLYQYGLEKRQTIVIDMDPDDRHSDYFCGWFSEQIQPEHLKTVGQKDILDGMNADLENARAAWTWAVKHEHFSRLTLALDSIGYFYLWRGGLPEGRQVFKTLLDALADANWDQEPTWILAWVTSLDWFSMFESYLRGSPLIKQDLQNSMALLKTPPFANVDTRKEQASMWLHMGYVDPKDAPETRIELFEKSLALYREINHHWGIASALRGLGRAERWLGRLDASKKFFEESLAYCEMVGDKILYVTVMIEFGELFYRQNRYEKAREILEHYLAINQELRPNQFFDYGLPILGKIQLYAGLFSEAHRTWAKCLDTSTQLGLLRQQSKDHLMLGFFYQHTGQYDRVVQSWEAAVSLDQDSVFLDRSNALLGSNALAQSDWEKAEHYLRESIEGTWPYEGIFGAEGRHIGLSVAMSGLGDKVEARKLLKEGLQKALDTHRQDRLMFALAGAANLLLEEGETERAVEIYALAAANTFVSRSKWFEDVFGQRIETASEKLPEDVILIAQARGRERDMWATAEELLKEMSSS